jgi:hypothetical protein
MGKSAEESRTEVARRRTNSLYVGSTCYETREREKQRERQRDHSLGLEIKIQGES